MRRGFRTHGHELATALTNLMGSVESRELDDSELGEAVCALAVERGADTAGEVALSLVRAQITWMDMATRHGSMLVMAALRVATPTAELLTTIADYMSMFFPELDEVIEHVRREIQLNERSTFVSLANELSDEVAQLYDDAEWENWIRRLPAIHFRDSP